eukprot:CAMPEP_0113719278 /NCGR_PEP_ID=MMETSP0038_2-20120614/35704_1 /TAXON_ID=2898 /ORGANISM="Cryptomonas paramecium" /LENGTH=60 /DNA_ID=CAMNT_0000647589 /DNA_START=92 /DNA_END=270 /DNA_ORIENTATION=- /assembly_acc=CAM_ASM_000170
MCMNVRQFARDLTAPRCVPLCVWCVQRAFDKLAVHWQPLPLNPMGIYLGLPEQQAAEGQG